MMANPSVRTYRKHKITVVESGTGYNITICAPTGEQLHYGQSQEAAASYSEALAEGMDMVDNIISRQLQGQSRR